MNQLRAIASRVLTMLAVGVCLASHSFAQSTASQDTAAPMRSDDLQYRTAMAKAVRTAAERFLPSVVTIEIIGAATGVGNAGEVEQDAPTSGVVVDQDGFVVASSIVLRKPSASLLVALPDGSRHVAKVVSRDHHRDLVLLKIKTTKPLAAVKLPEKITTRVGETTVAIGRYGADLAPMVSTGVLSAADRLDGIALQVDARVSPPFYGGALIDLTGNFLGILIPAVAKGGAPDSTSWYDSGIAFAIPGDVIKRKMNRLKEGEDITRGLIGIVPKTDDPLKAGTELAAVRTRSPAEKAGLKPGDEIVAIDSAAVKRFQQIRQILGRFDAGESISIKYKREKDTKEISIELAESIPPLQPQRLGFIAKEVSDDEGGDDDAEGKADAESSRVVVDAIVPGSPVDGKLSVGDVVLQIDGTQISDVQSMRRLMVSAEPDRPMKIAYQRDGKKSEVSLTPTTIAGAIRKEVPKSWEKQSEKEWKISPLKLPEQDNLAALVAPGDDDELDQLGLLVLLLNPGEAKPEEALKSWPNLARKHGVVVCAIAPSENGRWRPKEIDVVSRFVASVQKKVAIEKSAVAVAALGALHGGKAEAADSMALGVAISASETFFGVAVSHEARPPAVRLRENKADASLQLMLPIKTQDDLPTWGAALQKAGYPIVLGSETDEGTLLNWVRLLQSI